MMAGTVGAAPVAPPALIASDLKIQSRRQISVIDEDQGKSGAGSAAAHSRDGFAHLVSAVGLGEVGIVLAL
ncbi:MAG: hypothetical protein ACR2PL_15060 [Dehalococcoidia bacterium]